MQWPCRTDTESTLKSEAMAKLDAVKQSPASILQNAKNARKAYDKTWNSAARAPVFCKISKKTSADGKVCNAALLTHA